MNRGLKGQCSLGPKTSQYQNAKTWLDTGVGAFAIWKQSGTSNVSVCAFLFGEGSAHLFCGGVRGKGQEMDEYSFGYPRECKRCASLPNVELDPRVRPYFKGGDALRVMLIGQDPTIYEKPKRVHYVLMLDQERGALRRWLREEVFGKKYFDSMTLYATNLVKCAFREPPSRLGGLRFLRPYFDNCKDHLVKEVSSFQPTLVLTLGEPAHQLFMTTLDNRDNIAEEMKEAFTGRFIRARLRRIEFDYSPCLHIKTFRVAETYGEKLKRFKRGLADYFKESG